MVDGMLVARPRLVPWVALAIVAGVFTPSAARADEGMWTYDAFPKDRLRAAHGVQLDDAFLTRARLASVRLARGCSASFVSPEGLVMTNHHCARTCIKDLSRAGQDLHHDGFFARTPAEEKRCPNVEANQLVEIADVTARVAKATSGLADKAFNDALKAETARIEKECATADDLRCDVVTLYQGGKYHLYKYRRYQDVRLVFAPEHAIAFFGGDPDNFDFPRYDLDVTFLRVWKNGKPIATPEHFPWTRGNLREGAVTFVSGHPGRTSRLFTVAQLEYTRDVRLPELIARLSELRGLLTEFGNRGAEARRASQNDLFGVENSLKALKGRHQALLDKTFFAGKVAEEQALRSAIAKRPELAKAAGGAHAAIERALARQREIRKRLGHLEQGEGFGGELFAHARTLVRAPVEYARPNHERLTEYGDAARPQVMQALLNPAPIAADVEILKLTFSLTKLREALSPDDPIVRKVLGQDAPADLAARVVRGTKLADPAARKQLFDGGAAAITASKDPMIALARLVDDDARAIRKLYEDEIEGPIKQSGEAIAKARFAIHGTDTYPDATFTLRLSYGTVKGWIKDGVPVAPFTNLAGAFERATGRPPFGLPPSWLKAKAKLDLTTPFNFVSTNDIIGGNSGSPVFDVDGAVVGVIFDGNPPSLGGDYGFDPVNNRAISVDARAILHALERIYGAERLVRELRGAVAR